MDSIPSHHRLILSRRQQQRVRRDRGDAPERETRSTPRGAHHRPLDEHTRRRRGGGLLVLPSRRLRLFRVRGKVLDGGRVDARVVFNS